MRSPTIGTHIFSGRQSYNYFVTPLRNSQLFTETVNVYVTNKKRITRYCNGTVTYKIRFLATKALLYNFEDIRYLVTLLTTLCSEKGIIKWQD
jgi:hypothetical protein